MKRISHYWLVFLIFGLFLSIESNDEAICQFYVSSNQLGCSKFETWTELNSHLDSYNLTANLLTCMGVKPLNPITLSSELKLEKMPFNASFLNTSYYYVSFHNLQGIEINNWPITKLSESVYVFLDDSDVQFFVNQTHVNDLNCNESAFFNSR